MADKDKNLHPHPYCLLCGNRNPLGLQLQFTADESGEVSVRFKGRQVLQGYTGILHGGVIASLLDSAMTNCLFQQGVNAVTGDLHIRYRHPTPYNAELLLRARVVTQKRPLFVMKAELLIGDLITAHATARFMENPKKELDN